MADDTCAGRPVRTFSGDALGLALSGGGFRASFFHIGVLARLAEQDRLRDVQALSTVSGGSIVGALYYLFLKRLLEEKPDQDITRDDYLELVAAVEKRFLDGVRTNVRMRTFLDPRQNLRMFQRDYSRSDRIGELYDSVFYQGVLPGAPEGMLRMRDLRIHPAGRAGAEPFHPMRHNAQRRAKVPVLLINATVLNDGHSWLFEASTMGERPLADPARCEVDKNFRLCRPDSYDNTATQRDLELGLAVAASACVPGVFPPLALSGLYAEGVRVELVDGGVYDNQGVQALLDRRCTRLIVSDASGQMDDLADPAPSIFAVMPRANSILMDRTRDEQLLALLGDHTPPATLLHLRHGLPVRRIPWLDAQGNPACQDGPAPDAPAPDHAVPGVPAAVQDLLSRLRTDLDSFNDVEAYALMLDGYRMAGALLPGGGEEARDAAAPGGETRGVSTPEPGAVAGAQAQDVTTPEPGTGPLAPDMSAPGAVSQAPGATAPGTAPGPWAFAAIAPEFDRPGGPAQGFLDILRVGQRTALKPLALNRRLRYGAYALAAVLGLALLAMLRGGVSVGVSLGFWQAVGLLLGALAFFLPDLARVVRIAKWATTPALLFRRALVHTVVALAGAAVAWITLKYLDPIFLKAGRYPQEFK
ncbi:patatin-like phospholipase family protein [Desulfocurvus vexinensis]|uniref:patatin-like phospholipase family protein n=1 Tax=Desulfocurvus vexinensis TaxID=399548 RepID=UPI000686067B|nr:patatin-like phospholipase family protein [Desulfocurvus vexinensis]